MIETHLAWRWPFRPLSFAVSGGGLLGAYQATYRVWETFHGNLCWITGPF